MEIQVEEGCQYLGKELVFFMESVYDASLNEIILRRYSDIRALYESQGLRFIYLPALKEEVGERALMYAGSRGYHSSPIRAFKCIIPYGILSQITRPCLVHYNPDYKTFHIAQYWADADERTFMLFFAANAAEYTCKPEASLLEKNLTIFELALGLPKEEKAEELLIHDDANKTEDYQALLAERDNLVLLYEMGELWKRLEKRGINRDLLLMLMKNAREPIGLSIYSDCIELTNDSRDQLKLATIDRAFYLLYLLHPEGIDYKEMVDYKDELLRIYRALGPRGSRKMHETTISRFVDSTNNLMSISSSRIKRAFTALLCEDLVGQYLISGPVGGGKKSIPIDRSLVHWADSMLSLTLHVQTAAIPKQVSALERIARKIFGG